MIDGSGSVEIVSDGSGSVELFVMVEVVWTCVNHHSQLHTSSVITHLHTTSTITDTTSTTTYSVLHTT